MRDDDYELMPHTELEYLRHEVEKLKRNPLGDTQASISLLDSINKLNASVSKLNDIFTSANDDMVKAFHDTNLQDQLRRLQENQEKLAKGIVAVSEMVKRVEETRGSPLPPIESLAPKQHIEMNAQALSADLGNVPEQEFKPRNPFDDSHHEPILNEPLPRAANAPGYLLHPGLADAPPLPPARIPEGEIPPPPRRY